MPPVVKRIATGVSLAACFGLEVYANEVAPRGVVPWLVGTALLAVCVWELLRMPALVGRGAARALLVCALVTSVATLSWSVLDRAPWGSGPPPTPGIALLQVYGACLVLALVVGRGPRPERGLSPALLALWLVPPFAALVSFQTVLGSGALICLVVLSKIGDVFGYFIGRRFGRTKPFRVSPNKSVEGCLASLAAGTLAGGLLAATGLLPARVGPAMALGLLLNLAAQAADFFESACKRRAGVKDSSGLAGPAGGVLDVVDSLLLTAPLGLVLWTSFLGD